ncbi:MAG: hypothetical protein ACK41Q_01695 [Candidatus Brocadia sp.]
MSGLMGEEAYRERKAEKTLGVLNSSSADPTRDIRVSQKNFSDEQIWQLYVMLASVEKVFRHLLTS